MQRKADNHNPPRSAVLPAIKLPFLPHNAADKAGHSCGRSFQRIKKVCDFFARFKNATFFAKTSFHEKSRYARQKVRTGHF